MMAKGLFLGVPATGHINPSLSLVKELVASGHDIDYYCNEEFAELIGTSGATFRPYARPMSDIALELRDPNLLAMSESLVRANLIILEDHYAQLVAANYHFIIHDTFVFSGSLIAKAKKIPSINSQTIFATNGELLRRELGLADLIQTLTSLPSGFNLLRMGLELKSKYGYNLDIGRILGPDSDLTIVYTSRYFQLHADLFPESKFCFAGPTVAARKVQHTSFQNGKIVVNPEDSKRVYVSLGTLFNNNLPFFLNAIEIFRDYPEYNFSISTGKSIRHEHLGEIPGNIVVREFMPQLEILQDCHIFVTHGGMNSVNESILHGVPMIVCPQQREQLTVGKRVEELRAGILLEGKRQTGSALKTAFDTLLNQYSQYRDGVVKISESFLASDGMSGAVARIETMLL